MPDSPSSLPTPLGVLADGDALRALLRRLASPVTVVTLTRGGVARGVTIGSFTSVSLAPPLISFNVQKASRSHALLHPEALFAVNILADTQGALSNHFADPSLDEAAQFTGVPHSTDPETGLPLLTGALGALVCHPFALHDAGDHTLVLGQVTRVLHGDPDASPLLYLNRTYRAVGAKRAV